MDGNSEVERLKREIDELKKTIMVLRETVNQLTQTINAPERPTKRMAMGTYDMSPGLDTCLEDASWGRLLNLLNKAETGLTATELAKRWGKSRSRTSEVLNKLVEEGRLVKYRDGREIRFRPAA